MTNRKQAALAAIAAAVAVTIIGTATLTPTSATPLDDQASMLAACTERLADARPLTTAQRTWLRTCRDAFLPPSPTPTPSGSASPSPTVSPSASPTPSLSPSPSVSPTGSPTPSPSPSVPVSACPPPPAFPDAACTGWRHTGVALHTCPTTLSVAGGTYDSCLFAGTIRITAANVTVTRSHINGGHVEGVSYDLRGARLIDVEIAGAAGDTMAAIGNSNYACTRCNIYGGLRGLALGSNVTVVDSYVHGMRVVPGSHQTAASTHGGAHVRIEHSTLRCESDRYACSNGVSFYSEDSPGIDDMLITRSHISTDAGYCIGFFSLQPGKPYGITNTRIVDNVLGSSEYGPVANWPSGQAGNVWSGNTTPSGTPINP
jgi:hypothetical protein